MAPPVSTSAVVSATMAKPELSRQTSVPPDFTSRFVNLADPRLGAKALFATDEFFAAKERMLNPEPAVFVPGKYDEHGKWMDGWETRRKRTLGYNYCVVQLARPGVIRGLDIDTSYFTGNFPPAASLDGCFCPEGEPTDKTPWTEVLPSTTLKGNSHHYLDVDTDKVFTHVRLNIYPDGGVARLRVFSMPQCDWEWRQNNAEKVDLIAMENGGHVVASNDQHYGKASNLLLPGRGVNMGDGWETRRRREPGNDWCIIALAHPGEVEEIEVDTAFFKGNYPDRCSIQAANVTGGTFDSLVTQSMFWPVLLQEHKLQMDAQHFFKDVEKLGPITHIRFNIIPDGGVSRLRLFGRLTGAKKTHRG